MFGRIGGNITDDSGKWVKLLDPAGASPWPSRSDHRIETLVQRVRKVLSQGSSIESLVAIGLVGAFLAVYVPTRAFINRLIPAAEWSYPLALLALCVVASRLSWRARLQTHRTRVAALILEEGLCPTCGYNLAGTNAEDAQPDVLIACPECGGAWRRNRIERLAPFQSLAQMRSPGSMFTRRQSTRGGGGWSALDARGCRVDLTAPSLRRPFRNAASPEVADRVARASVLISGHGRVARRVVAVAIIVIVMMLVAAVPGRNAWTWLLGVAVSAALALPALLANFAYAPGKFTRVMLEHELCPACGTDMHAIPRAARDGATLCPHCRSAWQML